jgi:hypothetical protein
MGFRQDIDLTQFVSSVDIGLGQADSGFRLTLGPPVAPPSLDQVLYPVPSTATAGAVTRSTSLELEGWPSVVWDVNGYYHALGVGFRASRRQLMRGYAARGGQGSDYLTYVLAQLLDPQVRRKYDACPMRSMFFDRYVEEEIRRRALKLARKRGVEPEQILAEWGFEVEEKSFDGLGVQVGWSSPVGHGPVDIPQESRENGATSVQEPEGWPYTYYVWNLRRRDDVPANQMVMRRWQEAIVSECQRRGVTASFAVGLMGPDRRRLHVMSVHGARVAFISADHVHQLDQLAKNAAHRLSN